MQYSKHKKQNYRSDSSESPARVSKREINTGKQDREHSSRNPPRRFENSEKNYDEKYRKDRQDSPRLIKRSNYRKDSFDSYDKNKKHQRNQDSRTRKYEPRDSDRRPTHPYRKNRKGDSSSESSTDLRSRRKTGKAEQETKQTRLAKLAVIKFDEEYKDLLPFEKLGNDDFGKEKTVEEIQKLELCKRIGVNADTIAKFSEDLKAVEEKEGVLKVGAVGADPNLTAENETNEHDSFSRSVKSKTVQQRFSDNEMDPLEEYMIDLHRQNKDLSNTDERVKVILSSQEFAGSFPGHKIGSQDKQPEIKEETTNLPKMGSIEPTEVVVESLVEDTREQPQIDQIGAFSEEVLNEGELNRQFSGK